MGWDWMGLVETSRQRFKAISSSVTMTGHVLLSQCFDCDVVCQRVYHLKKKIKKKKHLLTRRDIKETVLNYTDCLSMLICIRKTLICWTALQAPRQGPSHEAGIWGWHTDWTACIHVKTFSSYGVKVIC